MKQILRALRSASPRQWIALSLLLLLLVGCTDSLTGGKITSPLTSALTGVTRPAGSGTTTGTLTDLPPLTSALVGDYRWDPYVFDRLAGEDTADAKALADAILSYEPKATLSSATAARRVADNIAFEFPPAALVDLTVSGNEIAISYLHDRSDHDKQIAAFEGAMNRALALVASSDSEAMKAQIFYTYVVQTVAYFSVDYTDHDITAFSALVRGQTICYGFADAFGYLLRQVGMEAHLWRGGTYTFTGFSDHGWCYAKIDGQFYHFDPTWERSASNNGTAINYHYYGIPDRARFNSLAKSCVTGFGDLQADCDLTLAPDYLPRIEN